MVKSYENLTGAVARGVFFRPERQRVREMLSRDSQPHLLVDGQSFPLFDLSMNGLSFLAPGGPAQWPVGQEIDLSLLLHGEEVYSGPARVARAEPGIRNGSLVGLGLVTGFLDLPEIQRQDDMRRLDRELAQGPQPLSQNVPEDYQRVVAEIVHFLGFYRRSLHEHESYLSREPGVSTNGLSLEERAYEAMKGPWWNLQLRAARAALQCFQDREVLIASKRYTEDIVTPLVLESELGKRTYHKPLGYAGDYKAMLHIYDNSFEGDSVFGRVIHKFFPEDHPLGRGIRTRKDLIVDVMENEHKRVLGLDPDSATFQVTSLGCGPALEVSDFIRRNKTWPGRVIWTLIDQEEEALSVAYRASRKEIGKWGGNGDLFLLNLSFVQMMSEGVPLREKGSQHFIFSAGLFDYLRKSRAQVLIEALFEFLAPGGLMMIGNAIAPNEFFWAAEFLVDWSLLYRTKDEMRALAARLPETAEVDVIAEPSGGYYFLRVRKHN
jgi:hypothetical protein